MVDKVRIYTKNGDFGTTRLRDGAKVSKSHAAICALGDIDEIQAVLGMARAECNDIRINKLILDTERDLWAVMAVVASTDLTQEENAAADTEGSRKAGTGKKQAPDDIRGKTLLLEQSIDRIMQKVDLARGFVLPGESKLSSYLDFARTVVRRAEREIVGMGMGATDVQQYLNRLSDWCWALARSVEPNHILSAERVESEPTVAAPEIIVNNEEV